MRATNYVNHNKMVDIFLTKKQKHKLSKWVYSVNDNSITTKIFNPFWDWLVTFFPQNVAPNIISLTGLLCIFYAYYLTFNFLTIYPKLIAFIAFLLVFVYMNLDAIDGKHARRIGNSTPLGELFDHSCDNIGVIFMVLTLCYIIGIKSMYVQRYIVQTAQLIFLYFHIKAYEEKIVKFGLLTGPGECIIIYMCAILGEIFYGYNWTSNIIAYLSSLFGLTQLEFGYLFVTKIYHAVYIFILITIIGLSGFKHYSTRNGLFISLFIRLIPSILIHYGLLNNSEVNTFTIISHGLIMSIISGDIIVAKMANRQLHPLIPILTIISLFDNFLCIAACVLYYFAILTEISHYLRIPLFSVQRNVYCNGVYDLLHEAHMNLFEKASSYGNKLIVGVHNDTDVESYKRKPVRTHEERCILAQKCKFVDEIIPNAPLIITKEFIKKYNIHVVVCSSEYDSQDDKYYQAARELKILHVLPRMKGVSTSNIIKRVKDRNDVDLESKQN